MKRRNYSPNVESNSSIDNRSSIESIIHSKRTKPKIKRVINKRLLKKLAERGETLQEREERREKRRAEKIRVQFGYTAESNPFNDPNLASSFYWDKREEQKQKQFIERQHTYKSSENIHPSPNVNNRKEKQTKSFQEIKKVRQRRKEYEEFRKEKDRIRLEESRIKELKNYHQWERKEENFHLQQLRQRSAIRIVDKRERPIDLLAKNILILGLTNEDKSAPDSVKYRENYNAIDELNSLELELEDPSNHLKDLKLSDLRELLIDVDKFRTLEREVKSSVKLGIRDDFWGDSNIVLRYWDGLYTIIQEKIRHIETNEVVRDKNDLLDNKLSVIKDIHYIFQGKRNEDLIEMRKDILDKLDNDEGLYWHTVLEQLEVYLAKADISDIHMKILVCQLEKLEKRKSELGSSSLEIENKNLSRKFDKRNSAQIDNNVFTTKELDYKTDISKMNNFTDPNFGNLEEDLGLSNEVNLGLVSYMWNEKYRPRKPRYFNRVKTGYDWNKYNQTHYDHDCPPPKIVQGYKFNIFYPDLVDRTSTPSYRLEPADTNEFCIIRFHSGPPYEDVAFKVINREWNRSRKRGFRSTFERGVLSVYFNFTSHWYRR